MITSRYADLSNLPLLPRALWIAVGRGLPEAMASRDAATASESSVGMHMNESSNVCERTNHDETRRKNSLLSAKTHCAYLAQSARPSTRGCWS
jgi:hypothetical protein